MSRSGWNTVLINVWPLCCRAWEGILKASVAVNCRSVNSGVRIHSRRCCSVSQPLMLPCRGRVGHNTPCSGWLLPTFRGNMLVSKSTQKWRKLSRLYGDII
jgi:hypothetical protein